MNKKFMHICISYIYAPVWVQCQSQVIEVLLCDKPLLGLFLDLCDKSYKT